MQDLGGTAQKNARMRKGKADVVSLTGSGKGCTKALFIVLLLVFIVCVRSPRQLTGACFLLPPCGFQMSDSGYHLSAEPCPWSKHGGVLLSVKV